MRTRINSIAFSPDGKLLAVSAVQDTTMQVWPVSGSAKPTTFGVTQHTDYPPQLGGGAFMVAFSPDGRVLAVAGIDGVIRLYSVPGFALLDYFRGVDSTSSLAFSPNGRYLALGSADGNVYLNPVSETPRLSVDIQHDSVFSASSKQIFAVHFLSNNSLIAGGLDGIVRFWTMPAAAEFIVITPTQVVATHAGQIAAISYSAPLRLLATASPSGTRVWDADPARVATHICQTLKAPVRTSLWKEYLPDIPYTPVC